MRRLDTQREPRTVKFLEDPIKPQYFSLDEPVDQFLATPKDDQTFDWTPIPARREIRKATPARGSKALFQPVASSGAVTLKPDFLQRFAAVQTYERLRRDDLHVKGENPGLGQLDYGTSNYKIALQSRETITAHDIGMPLDNRALGSKDSTARLWAAKCGPMMVWGAFKEPFVDAAIPTTPAEAYKAPFNWPRTASEGRLEKFVNRHFKSPQHAA